MRSIPGLIEFFLGVWEIRLYFTANSNDILILSFFDLQGFDLEQFLGDISLIKYESGQPF